MLATPPERVRFELRRAYEGRALPPILEGLEDELPALADLFRAVLGARARPGVAARPRAAGGRRPLPRAAARRRRGEAAVRRHPPRGLFAEDTLRIDMPYDVTADLGGRGLLFVPSAFTWPRPAASVEPPWQPFLVYPARGVGGLWEPGRSAPPRGARRPARPAPRERARRGRRAALDHRAGARARALPRQRLPAPVRAARRRPRPRPPRRPLGALRAIGEGRGARRLTIGRYLPILPRRCRAASPEPCCHWRRRSSGRRSRCAVLPRVRARPCDARAARVARADGPRDALQGARPARGARAADLRLGGRRRGRGPPAPAAVRADRRGSRGRAPIRPPPAPRVASEPA